MGVALELRVILGGEVEGVDGARQLRNLHPLPAVAGPGKVEPGGLDLVHDVRVHFVPVPVSLLHALLVLSVPEGTREREREGGAAGGGDVRVSVLRRGSVYEYTGSSSHTIPTFHVSLSLLLSTVKVVIVQ